MPLQEWRKKVLLSSRTRRARGRRQKLVLSQHIRDTIYVRHVTKRFPRTLATACAIIALGQLASAATLVVTNASDTPAAGTLTLREAVANSRAGEVITFAVQGPIYLERGEIEIVHDLEVRGPADALLRIERRLYPEPPTAFRLFRVRSGRVQLSNLALVGGWIRHRGAEPGIPGGDARGGAIFNEGELTIVGCMFQRNAVAGGWGSKGEVGSAGGTGEGGVIYNRGTLEVRNSLFHGNSAAGGDGGYSRMGGFPAGAGSGAALFNAGRAVVFSSTFISNHATGGLGGSGYDPYPGSKGGPGEGGAIANRGEITLENVTVHQNSARGGHGGYYSAPNGASGEGGDAIGGGVSAGANPESRTTLRNTLVTGNRIWIGSRDNKPGAGVGVNVAGAVESRGYNLVGDATDSSGWQASDRLGTFAQPIDPLLRTYAHLNGGTTLTLALRPGSPAIDAGGPPEIGTDQRGLARTFDDPEVENVAGGNGTDIGAFELQPAAPSSLVNLSARGRVLAVDRPLIGGVIISGTAPRRVLFTGRGMFHYSPFPENTLQDAVLELYDHSGRLLAQNDNWEDVQRNEIRALGLYELYPFDAAILITVEPGAYTAVVRGKDGRTGLALVEAYGISPAAESYLSNLGVRAEVGVGDDVVIDGFIVGGGGGGSTTVYMRALGLSLINHGVVPLIDPTIALHDEDGNAISFNNDWKDTQRAEIEATGIPPSDDLESAIVADLPPGAYTAVVRGNRDVVGVSVVEIYNLDD